MTGDLLLGVDIGTESARAVVMDSAGAQLGAATQGYHTNFPRPGWAEQDPREVRQAVLLAMRSAAKPVRGRIAGISVASTAVTAVTLDKTGSPRGPAILWVDVRASKEADEITRTGHPALARTGGVISPEWMLPKALWLKRHELERYRSTAWLVEVHDWIIHILTGRWVLSRPNVCAEWSYVPSLGGWPTDLLDSLGLDDLIGRWPNDLLAAGEIVGGLTPTAAGTIGLSAGTPVIQGLMDSYASALAANVFQPGRLAASLGTSSSYLSLTDREVFDRRLLGPVEGAFESRFVVQGGQSSAGACLRWFCTEMAPHTSLATLDAEAGTVSAGSDGLAALDTFSGSRTPYRDPLAQAAFCGLTVRHSRAHLYRALLEAIAFGGRQVVEVMRLGGVVCREITFCGGGAQSDLWMQIHADVLGTEISAIIPTSPAALGAAMCAAAGARLHSSLGAAVQAMTPVGRIYEPSSADAEVYAVAYQRYQAAYAIVNGDLSVWQSPPPRM